MYLSKIEIFGFKSFGQRVRVDFRDGVSSIIGPNGTGKTNIIDAVRWVIGERRIKLLRGGTLDDVIFNGTSTKKPLNMAEVTISFEDCRGYLQFDPEANQLTVTRRAFRDGNSEFILNGRAVRMKDVRHTLLGLGISSGVYSIIEQHMMKQIIDEDPDSRRMLFEEAADILKFKNDRKATEQKLDTTIQDLERIEDIQDEIKNNVDKLRKQAARARRYTSLRNEFNETRTKIAFGEYSTWHSSLDKIRESMKVSEDKLSILKTEKARLIESEAVERETERRIQKSREEVAAELNESIQEIARLEREIAVWQEKIKQAEIDTARALEDKKQAKEKISQLIEDEYTIEENRTRLEKRIPAIKDDVDKWQANIDDLNIRILDLRKKRNELFEQKRENEKREWEWNQKKKQLTERRVSFRDELGGILARISELEEKHEDSQRLIDDIDLESGEKQLEDKKNELSDINRQRKNIEKQISHVRNSIIEKDGERSRLKGELEGLASQTNDARAAILREKDTFSILGSVADFLIPKDEETARMLQVVLGERAEFFVVEKAEDAEKAVSFLRERKLGIQGFVVLSEFEDKSPAGSLSSNISTEYPGLHSLITGVNISQGDEEGTNLPYMPVEMPEGAACSTSMFWKRGLRYGGFYEKGIVNVKARERKLRRLIDENLADVELLRKETEGLDAELTQIRETEENVGIQLKIDEKRLNNDKLQARQLELDIANLERELARSRASSMKIDSDLKQIDTQLEDRPPDFGTDRDIPKEIGVLSAEMDDLESQRRKAEQTQKELQFELVKFREELKRYENELNRIAMSLADARTALEKSRNIELEAASQSSKGAVLTAEMEEELQKAFEVRDRQQKVIDDLQKQENAVRTRLSDILTKSRELQKTIGEDENSLHSLDNERIRLEERIEQLKEDFPNIDTLDLEGLPPEKITELKTILADIEEKLEKFGPVNFEAEMLFEEENKRYEHYQKQLQDINQSVKTLRQSISKLNSEAERLFTETFDETRRNFKRLFRELFNGGDADIELVNKDGTTENINVLEADINVLTQPPGKRRLNITQLSAGEKSLVAISLLFGLYLVRPSPFCFLDEVDAPLDETNVGRFIKIVRRFQENTQFILITHNRKTMQAMDYLYGMSMEEGVSQVVGMALDDLNKEYLDSIGAQ